jgi:putative NADH-flavin reductase
MNTLAIFGATGGTGFAVLTNALKAGHTVTALVRTPSKLSDVAACYPKTLSIVQRNIASLPAIKSTLAPSGKLVDVVVSGLGMVLQRSGILFTSLETHICEEGTRNILSALAELEAEGKGYGKRTETGVFKYNRH